uniref:Beta-hexosaminidase n=1 Tax=Dolopus genitalis TaxID=2488630 RepID=A0A3G5BIJ3_DOLGE|nr:venom polypeptide [Dolopus genitalis]
MIGFVVLLTVLTSGRAYIVDPGPVVKATVGEVWPRPHYQSRTDNFFLIDPKNIQITIVGHTCDTLEQAAKRYLDIISNITNQLIRHPQKELDRVPHVSRIREIALNLTTPCEHMPYLGMDERYYLAGSGRIISYSIWGILRGLETYSQLITPHKDGLLRVPDIRIRDYPRFPHRGFLLDTSRHYMSMETIYNVLDGMEYNKLNVFHWHIVDDHSFPYQSINFPELSEKGAYMPGWVYTQEDIANVIEYARLRGIRVVAEFDVPGHTRSWGQSHPEILTQCEGNYAGKMGPINPIKSTSYDFLKVLFKEVLDVFPDRYLHVGGDEVGFECWESNSQISSYVRTKGITFTDLQRIFMENVTRMITDRQAIPVVWQEAMVKDVNMPNNTVVQVWTGNWRDLLQTFTKKGHRVLMSQCWYLDHLLTGGDWLKFYRCEPHDFLGTDDQKKLVMGGEACMWSEVVNNRNVLQRIFPRVSAAAERLWSPRETTNTDNAKRRLEEHTCRMIHRGIPAQPPNGPGIC